MADPAPIYDPDKKKAASPELDDLKRQERAADDDPYKTDWGGQYGSDTPGHYRSDKQHGDSAQDQASQEHPDQVGRGYRPNKTNGQSRFKFLSKRKGLLLAAGASSSLLIIVAILAFLLPALKIPQLAAHIEEYRLVRLTRTFYKQASILTSEKVAIDVGDSNLEAASKSSATGVKLASLRPQAVINNMKAQGILDFGTEKGLLGAEKIKTVKIRVNGQVREIATPKYSLASPIASYKERLRFASQVNQAVHDALRGNNYLVRSNASKKLLNGFGIRLQWWENKGAKYLGLSQDEADRLALQETTGKIKTLPIKESKINGVKDAARKANQAVTDCEADAACAKKMITTGEFPPEVTSKIDGIVNMLDGKATAGKVLGLLNPIYGIGMPVCIVYDGSVQASDAFVNSQNIAATKTFLAVAIAADQQKKGDVTAKAVGAFNRRVGDIANSIPEKIARGESVDTSNEVSPQAARSGEFSIFNVIFSGGLIGDAANAIAGQVCPYITDTGIGIGIATVTVVLALLTGGAEQGVGDAATGVISRVASKIAQKFVTIEGRASLKNTAKKYASSSAKTGAATEGATYLARMLVLAEMGAFYNGTSKDNLANEADAGATAYANEQQRQQLYGRPLMAEEVKLAKTKDKEYLAQQKASQSTFEKYFALSNPDSVVASLAMRASELKLSSVASFFLNIPKIIGSIFSPLSHALNPLAGAVATTESLDYSIVQWGWSPDEEALIDREPSFGPLENAKILTASGQEKAISDDINKCFTKDIGTLLTDNSVVRDTDGNLKDEGDCSPTNLGPNNSKYDKNGCNHCVFRWRLNQSYRSTLDELLGIQNPTAGPSTTNSGVAPTPGGPTVVPNGNSQQLAKQLLDQHYNGTINGHVYSGDGKYNCTDNNGDCNDLDYTATGKSLVGAGNCKVDAIDVKVIQTLLLLIEQQNYSIGTYALCSNHAVTTGVHNDGIAVDIRSIDGESIASPPTEAKKNNTLKVMQFLNTLPAELNPKQLINDGYGGIHYQPLADLEINGGKSCPSCFTGSTAEGHRDHIHVGY